MIKPGISVPPLGWRIRQPILGDCAAGDASRPRTAWTVAGLILLSLLVTLAFSQVYSGQDFVRGTDYAAFYEPVGRQIAAGHGVVTADGELATRYPPGYPFVVAAILLVSAAIGVSESTMFVVAAAALTALIAVIVFVLARAVWGTPGAVVASLLWATYPLALWLTLLRSSELAFIAVLYLSFATFWHAWHISAGRAAALAAGLLAGLAMLIRPIAIGLPLILACLLLAGSARPLRARVVLAALLLAGAVAAVLPWELWVYRQSGQVLVLSSGGGASMRDGLTFAVNRKGFRTGTSVPDDVAGVMNNAHARYAQLDSSGAVAAFIADQWRERPAAVTKLFLLKAARSWYGTDSNRQEGLIRIVQGLYLALVAGATVAAWRREPRTRRLAVSVWLIVLYFWGMTVLVLSIARYMVPVMGLLFLLVPAAIPRRRAALSL